MNKVSKQTILISIILLLIGVSISSAISVDTKTIITNNQNDECRDCNKVRDADLIRVERLLDKVEVYSKLLSVLSKYNSELKEMSEELSNQLSNINKLYDEFNTDILQQGTHPICIILVPLYIIVLVNSVYLYHLGLEFYYSNHPLLGIIFISVALALEPITFFIIGMIKEYECELPF